jgi:hypothetical protein
MQVETIRSRVCRCGIKLLLRITKDAGEIVGFGLTKPWADSTVRFIHSKTGRNRKLGSFDRTFLYCKSCKARVQVRTFDKIETEQP